jgi:TRAP-type C4-dicarboxylate transport system permease small subunit
MDLLVRWVERAAGIFLLAVALTTFATVVLRKGANVVPPDSFDIARLLLGIAVCWGIASACYRGGHIVVDVIWELAGRHGRRLIDLVATAALLLFMVAFAWMIVDAVLGTRAAGVKTFELHLPVWPFHMVAAVGVIAGAAMTALRLWELLRNEGSR